MELDKIIDRIRKLLRMAADTSSLNEAAIAAGRARKLMDQHQISLDDLRESNGFGFEKIDNPYRFMSVWKNVLSVAVAKFNDCRSCIVTEWQTINKSYAKTVGSTEPTSRLMFQGFEADVAVATAMYDYLTSTVDRLCARYIAKLGYTKYPAKLGDAYKKAAAQILCERMAEMQAERERELKTSTGTSLVVFKMAQVEAEFGKANYKNTSLVSRKDAETYAAICRGREDGASISLSTQIGGKSAGTLPE